MEYSANHSRLESEIGAALEWAGRLIEHALTAIDPGVALAARAAMDTRIVGPVLLAAEAEVVARWSDLEPVLRAADADASPPLLAAHNSARAVVSVLRAVEAAGSHGSVESRAGAIGHHLDMAVTYAQWAGTAGGFPVAPGLLSSRPRMLIRGVSASSGNRLVAESR